MGHAIARQRQLNPKDLFDDVHDLARVNPEAVAKHVVALARKKNSGDGMLDSADHNTGMLLGTVGALALTGMMGAMAGRQNAKRDAMVAEWEAQGNSGTGSLRCTPWQVGVKDPTVAFWKLPWLAVTPIVTGTAWLIARKRRHKKTKGKRSIAGGGEVFWFMSTVLNGGLLLADAISNMSYCKREAAITSGAETITLAPTG